MRAYLAVAEREEELLDELSHAGAPVLGRHGRLVIAGSGPRQAAWASTVWLEPEILDCASIGTAVALLAERGKRWAPFSHDQHRRTTLIERELGARGLAARNEPLAFGARPASEPLGAFCLLPGGRLVCSARTSNPFVNGEAVFLEDRTPPSRAYLKLWELFTLTGRRPKRGETCLDLGSSPGGWTWVLAKLGARVESIDKASLDPKVARLPGVTQHSASAFSIDPARHGPVDWLFSDVICYPERLLEYVERWLERGRVKNLVCSIKFQGATDHAVARRFARIKGSRLQHLHHNKHELTWWRFG